MVDALHRGAVILYPTDTVYAIGCDLLSKSGQERIRQLRKLPESKPLTFVVPSISYVSEYGLVSDTAYKVIRRLVPGPYTFLLPATKLVPKLVLNPKRKTTGIRVPDHPICQTLIKHLGNPLISMSAKLPDAEDPESLDALCDLFDPHVDMIIIDELSPFSSPTSGPVSTMIDFTGDEPVIAREGLGIDLALAQW